MKALYVLSGLLISMPVVGSHSASVFEAHDKFPERVVKDTGNDNECNEHHHLQPDGDHDCDDPKGVPEPSPLPLLVVGVAGVFLSRRWTRG